MRLYEFVNPSNTLPFKVGKASHYRIEYEFETKSKLPYIAFFELKEHLGKYEFGFYANEVVYRSPGESFEDMGDTTGRYEFLSILNTSIAIVYDFIKRFNKQFQQYPIYFSGLAEKRGIESVENNQRLNIYKYVTQKLKQQRQDLDVYVQSSKVIIAPKGFESELLFEKKKTMPWTSSNPPASMKNMSDADKSKGVKIANELLSQGKDEGSAIAIAISQVKKGKKNESKQMKNQDTLTKVIAKLEEAVDAEAAAAPLNEIGYQKSNIDISDMIQRVNDMDPDEMYALLRYLGKYFSANAGQLTNMDAQGISALLLQAASLVDKRTGN